MDEATKGRLRMAQAYCDQEDKSTEFMVAYMADVGGVTEEEVYEYLIEQAEEGSDD